MAKLRFLFAIFFITVFLQSCKDDDKKTLPGFTGKMNEVVFVVDDFYWEGEVGNKIKTYFAKPIDGLPQEEAIFGIIQIPHKAFTKILQRHRTVVMLKIKDDLKNGVELQKDVWARGQIVFNITATSEKNAIQLIENEALKIIDKISDEENAKINKRLEATKDLVLAKKIKEKFGANINITKEYKLVVDAENFMWLRFNQTIGKGGDFHEVNRNIMIYQKDYLSRDMFETDNMIQVRDSVAKKYIPGSMPNSYMTTTKMLTPFKKVITRENYTVELRGLWNLENDFMGGAFLNYAFLNEMEGKILYVDAFLYSPKFDKRDYLKEQEAIIRTVSFK
jgi:hypothetical protein